MRGDRPQSRKGENKQAVFTPHARGSTLPVCFLPGHSVVYPACAGIDPLSHGGHVVPFGLPRMRGDRPCLGSRRTAIRWFTPHARGSTAQCIEVRQPFIVYPACAGIDLLCGAPRAAGSRFTPHARGSTSYFFLSILDAQVYPACAGIDPSWQLYKKRDLGLPRMRGDRPS